MILLRLLVLRLTFYCLIANADAWSCQKGQKMVETWTGGTCQPCPEGHFQPEVKRSKSCNVCTKCEKNSWSFVKEQCTKEKNTICQCKETFVPSEPDSSTCQCNIGFGLKHGGEECLECEHGYFSSSVNSQCKKWQKCKSGVKIQGTTVSDVVCNQDLLSDIIRPTPTGKKVSLLSLMTSRQPDEGAQTQGIHTTTTTTSSSRPAITHQTKVPVSPLNTGSHIGIPLTIVLIGLLMLTVMICKLQIAPHMEGQAVMQKHESLCRRPVEESGESSLSSLKLNPGEH